MASYLTIQLKHAIDSNLFFFRIAAFSISLINDRTDNAAPALDSLFMDSIVDIAIYKENTLNVGLKRFWWYL